ncbi:hypothetical protein OIU77_009028 [Salix suchowensis]|uniref:Uncharacterized protein n=1 Tax=Salix suchowensis TaxID=1278906 RepID=A0ABQ9ADX3_9ROSI|nr:hypothetical protein OIU77_009028 [Salix suchowensis]
MPKKAACQLEARKLPHAKGKAQGTREAHVLAQSTSISYQGSGGESKTLEKRASSTQGLPEDELHSKACPKKNNNRRDHKGRNKWNN